MIFYKKFAKEERAIFWTAAAVCLCCIFLLTPFADKVLFEKKSKPEGLSIGKITYQGNDTRLKQHHELVWRPTTLNQSIEVGDSIFAGQKSSAKVELANKNQITVGENSLIVFKMMDKIKVADLQSGNFRFKVNGKIKIAIQGEVTEVTGKNSEIQFFMDKNKKSQARLIRGKASVKKKNQRPVLLEENKVVQIPRSAAVPFRNVAQQPPTTAIPEDPMPLPPAILSPVSSPITYNWKLYDLYSIEELQIFEKTTPTISVVFDQTLSWTTEAQTSTVEFANNDQLTNADKFITNEKTIVMRKVFVGENFWRVTVDDKITSPINKFIVQPKFIDGIQMSIQSPEGPIPLVDDVVSIPMTLKSTLPNPLGFVVQASQDANFSKENSKLFWSASNQIKINFFKTGEYYYRFRSVSNIQELSDWSQPSQFKVFRPLPPRPPVLAQINNDSLLLGEEIQMRWNSQGIETRIEIIDSNGLTVKEIKSSQLTWTPEAEGNYQAQAWTVNQYGQQSSASLPLAIKVAPKPPPPLSPLVAKKEKPRSVASNENSSTLKVEGRTSTVTNEKFHASKMSLNAFVWTQFSSVQFYNNEANPIVSGLALHGTYWRGSNGFEGTMKSGAVGLNDNGNSQKSLKNFEGRYHYRIFTKLPWSLDRQLQISGFFGFEMYRNSGGSYSSSYDLVKFGTSLEFPWASRWTGGGEFVYGLGSDKTQKKEISGHVGYFLTTDWSLGVGYRVHLLEAGSEKSAPQNSLPYREGYTEGFSVLNYHF
tara:strand:+ start:59406 stop:61694 length:2289 start_codon:yes stop_codon:yes gene_type:complete